MGNALKSSFEGTRDLQFMGVVRSRVNPTKGETAAPS